MTPRFVEGLEDHDLHEFQMGLGFIAPFWTKIQDCGGSKDIAFT